jgi:hypothetical protein
VRKIAQARVRLAAQPFHNRLRDSRLADARFARYQHDAAIAAFRLLPEAHQQLDLLVAADQRGGARAQRLEAAVDGARAFYCLPATAHWR